MVKYLDWNKLISHWATQCISKQYNGGSREITLSVYEHNYYVY